MIITLEEAKTWLRIDSDEDNGTLEMLIGAAEEYLHNATGISFGQEHQLAKLYCLVLCADWYENRDLVGQQPSDKVRLTCQSIMTQLQNAYGGEDSG